MHVSGDSYGALLGYLVLDLLLRGRQGVVLGKILAHFYLQAFPYFKDWAMRLLAWPNPSATPRSRGGGISYARVLPPCPGSRCLGAVLSSP